MPRFREFAPRAVAFVFIAICASAAEGQSIEPRAYSNAPVGMNFLISGYAYTRGGVSFDTSLPVTNPQLSTSTGVLAYARTLDLWGRSGKFDVVMPFTQLSGTADYAGQPVQREVSGLGDPQFRVSMNFYGAPALTAREFARYEQDVIVGGSLAVSVPVGEYDSSKVVNIGTHRWSVRPELGVSKALGRWTLEGHAAVTLFETNRNFYGGHTRAQDPLYSASGHVIYNLPRGQWASLDATYFTGGRTTLDGALGNDLQQNWRIGATYSMPVDAGNSIKLYASRGVSARTGNSFDLLGIAWQHRWGGGP
jgi:hypothetical protein